MFSLEFQGGVAKPTPHTNEKFMLFFLVNGKEIPLYQMARDGLVVKPEYENPKYLTNFNLCKVFVSQRGFGVQTRFYSFYVKLFAEDSSAPIVTVRPFSLEKTGFFLRGKFAFLRTDQVLKSLSLDNESRKWVEKQGLLPINVLRSMVTVDRSEIKKGVRAVRIQKKGE